MNTKNLEEILAFIRRAEDLKTLLRHSWLSDGRRESVAEHTWRMSLMAILLAPKLEKQVDIIKVLEMVITHDLVEIEAGDHHVLDVPDNKHQLEKEGLLEIIQHLEDEMQQKLLSLWLEFEENQTPEAKFAQALDKLEVVIQHNQAELDTWIKEEFDLTLKYGFDQVAHSQVLTELRKLIKANTEEKIKDSEVER